MTLLDGKYVSNQIRDEIKSCVSSLLSAGGKAPHLAVIIVGHDPASETYVANKLKACEQVGFRATKIALPETITEQQLLSYIDSLNHDDDIDGFIVQLPLPGHIDETKVIEAIDFRKDVDGFHPINVGRMTLGFSSFVPATPSGIVELLRRYGIVVAGKHCVVVGRSNIVGKPVATLLMQKGMDATVTICHSQTRDLKALCLAADIIITAVGQPGLLTADMVKDGAVVIDVGITRVDDPLSPKGYHLRGDADFDAVAPKCSFITPVPGGVGPMTITMLLKNTLQAYHNLHNNNQ
ncbi:MAG TPA: bifunctional methylenetetrahydrofolate dehydrogenase/methenyltetrahydrofolate cyclohydrolase FolD [Bacteroidales bacterium]|nr:bifunctional methylenetetrahydrofolate dehydrogenase/methenyltetrahydrofolate cyclohydrolase FolD [Bacteroidales bacterium]